MGGTCSTNGEEQKHIQVIDGEARRKGPVGKPTHRWVNNINMDLGEIGWVVWTGLVWLRIETSEALL
jgi:hypothetical protein